MIGMDFIAKSVPDGYTLGLGGIATNAIAATFYPKLPFNVGNDFTLITTIYAQPNMLVVNLDLPARDLVELVDLLKKNPGKYSYASAGPGTTTHLSGEIFKGMTGVDVQHVPYRGGAPAMQDVITGQVHMYFDSITGALSQVHAGRVRPIAVTSAERAPIAPDQPAIAEVVPGFQFTAWTVLAGPAHLPGDVVSRLSSLSKQALDSEDLKKRYMEIGAIASWQSPEATKAFRASEEARLAPIIRQSGARPDQ